MNDAPVIAPGRKIKTVKTDLKNYNSTIRQYKTLNSYFNLALIILTAEAVGRAYPTRRWIRFPPVRVVV